MDKKKINSVTQEICTCDFWDKVLTGSYNPVAFDPFDREFCFEYEDDYKRNQQIMIYHCPACGGRTPETLRNEPMGLFIEDYIKQKRKTDDYYAKFTDEEKDRLDGLTYDIFTIEDAIAKLGQPDEQDQKSYCISGKFENIRVFKYKNISEQVVLTLAEKTKKIEVKYERKYLGKKSI